MAQHPNNTGLPDQIKSGIESLSGVPLDDVKVHYNSSQPAQINAEAYAQGTDIYVAQGREQHLAHEAWHVVQQKQGRVHPSISVNRTAVNNDRHLEAEATSMGRKAAQVKTASAPANLLQPRRISSQLVAQRFTTVYYKEDDMVGAGADIDHIAHKREKVHDDAKQRVKAVSEFNQIPSGESCNHGRSYDVILANLSAQCDDAFLSEGAETLLGIFANLNIQGIPANHYVVLNQLRQGNSRRRSAVDEAFQYYIQKIADYPSNLFYWPDKIKDSQTYPNIDLPGTAYNQAPQGWNFRTQKTGVQHRTDERNRVLGGVANLVGQGL